MTHDLSVFFCPKGVAVIGASRNPTKFGHAVVHNLITHGYQGHVYPVNPKTDEILGLRTYASMADVPDPLDLVVIALPAKHVEAAVEACGQRGVKGVTIIAGGFRETGTEGLEREQCIAKIADRYNIAVLGPNCIGSIDTGTPLNATFLTFGHPDPGNIALVTQSGAMAVAITDWAKHANIGLSRVVSLGNQVCVSETEMLSEVASDNRTQAIAAYLEGVEDGEGFLEVAFRISQQIPIVALKVGRGTNAARAVASHTGRLAGAEEAYAAAFRRAGILRANTLEELLDWTRAMVAQPLPQGNRFAVLTNAGGPGIMATDALEAIGMQLATLSDATKDYLRERTQLGASVENPVDILAGSGPGTYALCLDALLADANVDAIIVIAAPQNWFEHVSITEVVAEIGNGPLACKKPVLAVIMGIEANSQAATVLNENRIPNFAFPERASGALGAMWQRKQWLDRLPSDPSVPQVVPRPAGTDSLWPENPGRLPLGKAEQLLEAYQVPTPASQLTTSIDQAIAVAGRMGFPVALKLIAPDLIHKTDVGGVILNIENVDALTHAYNLLMNRVAPVEGVLIQQMIQPVLEVACGIVRDPQFGPLVMVGRGGTEVELIGDLAFELAPLTELQISLMLERTTLGKLLTGYRGQIGADQTALVDIIQRLAQIVCDWPQIVELEVNPIAVMSDGNGCFAIDSRVRIDG